MKSAKFSLKSRFKSFRFALNGLSSLLKNEHNSKIHLVAAIISIGMGIILKLNFLEWSLLIIVIGIVFLAELFNSSIETNQEEFSGKVVSFSDYVTSAENIIKRKKTILFILKFIIKNILIASPAYLLVART